MEPTAKKSKICRDAVQSLDDSEVFQSPDTMIRVQVDMEKENNRNTTSV